MAAARETNEAAGAGAGGAGTSSAGGNAGAEALGRPAWRWWRPWSRRAGAPVAGQEGRVGARFPSPAHGPGGLHAAREAAPDEDRGWRTAWAPRGGTERDLPPGDWRGLLLEAYEAYCGNPLAYAVIEQSTNFVLGGVRVVAQEARVQRAIDNFWHDPDNRMDQRVYAIQNELSLFGEHRDPAAGPALRRGYRDRPRRRRARAAVPVPAAGAVPRAE
jgi:hypothetical protein